MPLTVIVMVPDNTDVDPAVTLAGGFDAHPVSTVEGINSVVVVGCAHGPVYVTGSDGDEIWELWLTAAKTSLIIEQSVATTEPAYAAKHAFQLAQLFNNFYHRHHILTEPDEGRKRFLLATAAVVRRELIRVLDTMGITVPPVM